MINLMACSCGHTIICRNKKIFGKLKITVGTQKIFGKRKITVEYEKYLGSIKYHNYRNKTEDIMSLRIYRGCFH